MINKEKKHLAMSLQFKLAAMVFGIMVLSACVSITVMILIFGPVMRSNAQTQFDAVSASIRTLSGENVVETDDDSEKDDDKKDKAKQEASQKSNDYTAEEIVMLTTNNAFNVTKLDENTKDYNKYKLDIDEADGKIVKVTSNGIFPSITAYMKVKDSYYRFDSFTSSGTYWMVSIVILISFMAAIILGTVLTGFLSRIMLKPLDDLAAATAQITRGNFNVKIPVPNSKEYAPLIKSFNKMAKELAGIETLRGDFISNVSHEFKTPLASIQGFAKLLQDKSLGEEERAEYTEIIIEETTRLTKLAANILNLTRVENQQTVGKKTRFSLDEQIRKIVLMLEHSWSKKNIDMQVTLDDIYYVGNEELMAQIWQNIINNAIKFTPEGGIISVSLIRGEKSIICKIYDNGPQISPQVKAHIFDKFYQGDKSRATEGNGLGLALVKRVVDLCSGRVYADNVTEGGVCFTVELPYVIEDMM
ncbi:MAG: HAMP domain-containing histidine kinase [Ruminococcus sp.]|nr:HAMP domain-containing histidine kinase [Ruminococcus sp.]